jgi:proline dehydrogenase
LKLLNNAIVTFVKILPKSVVHLFAKKYIAGETLEDAIRVTKELNDEGIYTTIDVLGEDVNTKKDSEEAKNNCLAVLDAINKNKLRANLSLKPTQLGILIDRYLCFLQVSEILDKASDINNFIRIDMEDSSLTDDTLELYTRLRSKYTNVGVVVQAYLKRTYEDVIKQKANETNFRLCKGIYVEPEEIAFKDPQQIRDNYLKVLEFLFKNGNYVGIATHDEYLVKRACELIKQYGVSKSRFEFQMLYGVGEELRKKLNAQGFLIRVYVPFGKHWYNYSVRRLQENPQLAWYITKSIFSLS